jgi:hypothetical protein
MCIGVKPGEMDLLDTASTPNSYMPEGADVWFPRSFDPTVDPETGLAGGATASDLFTDCTTENAESWDSMNICNYIFKRLDGKFNGAPHDSEPGTNDIDSGHSRFDVLFVTSPANIHTADMRERNDYAAPYIPYRFYSPNDCQASTPDAAAPGDCANDKIIDYYLELRNLMVASGSPVNDPEQSRHFPLCVLQKIDE